MAAQPRPLRIHQISWGCPIAAHLQKLPYRLQVPLADGMLVAPGGIRFLICSGRSLEMSQGDRVIGRIGTDFLGFESCAFERPLRSFLTTPNGSHNKKNPDLSSLPISRVLAGTRDDRPGRKQPRT